jgi:kynurenine formamidase
MPSEVDIEALGRRLCNWSRWGDDDELGCLNYITPAKTASAAGSVRSGRIHSLAIPLDADGPQGSGGFRFNPIHLMRVLPTEQLRAGEVGFADDVVTMSLQGATQWDGLAHIAHRGVMYGGRPAASVTASGAEVNDIRPMADRIATRGVLADVALARGVETLAAGDAIELDELLAVLARQGTEIGEGDVLLVRTGYLESCRTMGWEGFLGDSPGLGLSVLEWLHERRIAAVAADNCAVEVKPYQLDTCANPFHVVALVYMGLFLGEIFDLSRLAQDCAADGRYEFFFVAPGLPITGAVATPVNPYAIK